MNIRKLSGLLLLLLTGLSNAAVAQSRPVTLQECLKYALDNNQNIAVSRYEEQIGEQQIVQARSRALPQVNGTGNLTDNFKRQVLVLPGEFVGKPGTTATVMAGTTYSTGIGVDASQALFDASAFAAVKAARAGRDYYQLSTRQSEEDVINQVAQAYYRILASQEQIKVQDSNISKLTHIIGATEAQYKVGLARKIDLDRIRVNLTNAQTERIKQLNTIATQTNQLKVLMGLPVDKELQLADVSLRDIEDRAATYAPPVSFNLQDRTEIRVLDAQIHLSDLQAKSIRAENYPKLSAFFNYTENGLSNVFGDYFKKNGQDVWYGQGSVGLRLNIPIFDGLGRQSRTKQAMIQTLELQRRREAIALSLSAGFESARYQMVNSITAIAAQKQNVTLAEEVYTSSQANYNLGLATLTDLLDAQTSYIQAQNSYTQALLDYKIAELETIRASGSLRNLLQ